MEYGGKTAVLHLRSNSHRRLPFEVRLPRERQLLGDIFTDIAQNGRYTATEDVVACFRRHVGRMEGGDFIKYQLVLRPRGKFQKQPMHTKVVVIERIFQTAPPLGSTYVHNFKMPDRPGLPTKDDPIICQSLTRSGGHISYRIYMED